MSGIVEVKTSLHIGAGKASDSLGSEMPIVRDHYDMPFIPGSSFKGVVRSFCESLLRSTDPDDKSICCDQTIKNMCVTNTEKQEFWKKKNSNEFKDHEAWYRYLDNKLCLACQLFGSIWKQGKIHFLDMKVESKTWNETMLDLRDSTAIDRESGTAKDKSKYDFEIIPSGVQFHFSTAGSNMEKWETGLILFAIDCFNNDFLTLGGLKSKGAGHISLKLNKISTLNPYDSKAPLGETITEKTKIIEFYQEMKKALEEKLKVLNENKKGGSNA